MSELFPALKRFVAHEDVLPSGATTMEGEPSPAVLDRVVPALLRLVFRLFAAAAMRPAASPPASWEQLWRVSDAVCATPVAPGADPLASGEAWLRARKVPSRAARPLAEAVLRMAEPFSPRQAAVALGGLYESLLDVRLVHDGTRFTLSPLRRRRKTAGVFYTPSGLAEPTVRRTLAPLLLRHAEQPLPRICDPACGTGAFLLAALAHLEATLDAEISAAELVTQCLYGVDLDPVAVELTRLALWLYASEPEIAPRSFADNVHHGNALLGSWTASTHEEAEASCAQHLGAPATLLGSSLHWPLTFAEIFAAGGFDVVLGNPPWETLQRERAEFVKAHRADAQPQQSAQWQSYRETVEAQRHWLKHATAEHPFRHQGRGKPYTYKLFTELAVHLLRPGGRLGLLVPSGLYTDQGSAELREWLLRATRWEWLYSFENRRGIFAGIDNRYKFAVLIAERRSEPVSSSLDNGAHRCADTETENRPEPPLRIAFMVQTLADWQAQDVEPPALALDPAWIAQFSPESRSIPELRNKRDLAICKRLYKAPVARLGKLGGDVHVHYAQGINLTTFYRNRLFRERSWWEEQGYLPDAQGRYHGPGGSADIALPLMQGAMLELYDPLYQGYEDGTWRPLAPEAKRIAPQYLMHRKDWHARWGEAPPHRLLFRNTGAPTNERSLLVTYAPPFPCGNSAQSLVLGDGTDLVGTLQLAAVLSSFVCDWALRQRMGSPNLNWYLVRELPLPRGVVRHVVPRLVRNTACLSWLHPLFAPQWQEVREQLGEQAGALAPVTEPRDRLRLRVENEALVASLYDLRVSQLAWILRDTGDEHGPAPDLRGFHRVQQLPAWSVRAYQALCAGKWHPATACQLHTQSFFDLLAESEAKIGRAR